MSAALQFDEIPSTPLERIKAFCPHRPYCSDDKTASLIRVLPAALKRKYMQINQPQQAYWLIFDLDHDNPYIWKDELLPAPNLMVITPETGRSHLFYAIEPVCLSANARRKPIYYMKAVKKGFGMRLRADPDYTSPVAKNPFHPSWHTVELHNDTYELGKLADYIKDDVSPVTRSTAAAENPLGRNCTLFDNLRVWAYEQIANARSTSDFDSWHRQVESRAETLNSQNNPRRPLPLSEIKATAKSVARWTWSHYTGSRKERGILQLDGDQLSLKERQSLGAAWTHLVRKEKTAAAINVGIVALLRTRSEITVSAVARASGISRQTISRHYKYLLKDSQIQTLKESLKAAAKQKVIPLRPREIAEQQPTPPAPPSYPLLRGGLPSGP